MKTERQIEIDNKFKVIESYQRISSERTDKANAFSEIIDRLNEPHYAKNPDLLKEYVRGRLAHQLEGASEYQKKITQLLEEVRILNNPKKQ